MPFVRKKGIKGLVFEPEEERTQKKHACADCFACRYCSAEHCRTCHAEKKRPGKTGA